MVSFILSILLIPYAVILAITAFLSFINLRNLIRYRTEDVISFFACFIFLAGLAFLGYFSYGYLSPIDWKEIITFNLGQGINF